MIAVDIKTSILGEIGNICCIVLVALDMNDVGISIETVKSCLNLIHEVKFRDKTIADSAFHGLINSLEGRHIIANNSHRDWITVAKGKVISDQFEKNDGAKDAAELRAIRR